MLKSIITAGIFFLPFVAAAQTNGKANTIHQTDTTKNQQHMDYKVNIGKIDVPKASIEEFRKQVGVTPKYLKTLPGYVKGDYYEMTDDTGDLHVMSVVTWQNKEYYEKAQAALKKHYEETGFNRMEFVQRLNLKIKYETYSLQEMN